MSKSNNWINDFNFSNDKYISKNILNSNNGDNFA
jgi:hypothetical protein